MAKKFEPNSTDKPGESPVSSAAPPAPATSAQSTPTADGLTVRIQLAPEQRGKYVSARCDTDLTHTEAKLCRRLQDAIEAKGKQFRGPASVLKHLLALIAAADTAAAK
jgi:hypothetical protein